MSAAASTATHHLRTAATEAVLVLWCLHLSMYLYCPLSLPLRCMFQGRLLLILLYPTLSLSLPLFLFIFIFLSIALTRSIYHGPYGFLVATPLRPWPICVLEQEQAIANAAPLTAPVTPVHARGEIQAVHIVVPHRPDADHWVEPRRGESENSTGRRGREPERESPSESPSESEPWHQFGCSRGHAKCFTPC